MNRPRLRACLPAAVLALSLVRTGRMEAQQELVTPAEVERIGGLKGIMRTPEDMEIADSRSFLRAADSAIVLMIGMPRASSPAEFAAARTALTPHQPVPGVGDEAFSTAGGSTIVLRRGNRQVQISTGYDVAQRGAPFFTPAQLGELAKLAASRLK